MSDTYTAAGKVKLINETQAFSSGFTKREFVITTEADSKHPQEVKFEVVKDNCGKLDDISVGQEVTVHFNLRGNEYNGKYYTNLLAWKLVCGADASQVQQQPAHQRQQQPMDNAPDDDDGLPF